jgi:hypothetical protein
VSSNVPIPDWMQQAADSGWDDDTVEDIPGYKFYNDEITLHFEPGPHVYYRFDADGNRVEVPGCTTVLKTAIDKSQALMPWATKLVIETLKQRMFEADGTPRQYSTEELFAWFAEAKDKHKEKLDAAGDIGHVAHDALERTIQYAIDNSDGIVEKLLPVKYFDIEPTESEQMAQSCFEAGISWIHKHQVKFLHTERKVYSREYDVSGTLDGIGLVTNCDDLKCCRGKTFTQRPAVIDWKSSNSLRDEYALQTAFYQYSQLEEFPDEPIYDRFILRLGKTDGKFEPWFIDSTFFEDDLNTFLDALSLYRSLKALEERRRVDKAELRAIIKKIRDEAKAIEEAKDKAERLVARNESKAETKRRNDAKEAHYRQLRDTGMNPKTARAIAYPKQDKVQVESKPVPNQKPEEKPFEIEWVLNL